MSKIYVDEILPKDASKISMPDAELPAGSVVQVVKAPLLSSVIYCGNTLNTDLILQTLSITPKYDNSLFIAL